MHAIDALLCFLWSLALSFMSIFQVYTTGNGEHEQINHTNLLITESDISSPKHNKTYANIMGSYTFAMINCWNLGLPVARFIISNWGPCMAIRILALHPEVNSSLRYVYIGSILRMTNKWNFCLDLCLCLQYHIWERCHLMSSYI